MAEPATPVTSRVVAYDVIRLAAMAGVVAIHVLAAGLAASAVAGATRFALLVPDRALNDLCVPAFLFLSGALVWRPHTTHPSEWWRRRLEVVFVPYLAWTLVYLAIGFARDGLPAGGPVAVLQRVVVAILTGNAWFHLYFPPLLVIVYLLRAPASRLVERPAVLLVVTLALQAVLAYAFHTLHLPQPAGLMLTNFLTLIPYAAIGAWFGANARTLGRRPELVAAAGLAGLGVVLLHAVGIFIVPRDPFSGLWQRYVMEAAVGALLMAAAVFLTRADARLAPAGPALHAGAGLAYGVYLMHPLVTLGLIALVPLTSPVWASGWFLATAFIGVLALTLGLTRMLKMTRATAWLV